MNPYDLPYCGKVTKANGRIFPALERLFNNSTCVPYPKTSLLWMEAEERKFTYSSDNLMYRYQANIFQEELAKSPEAYYENRLYETIVGSLLRKYLSKNGSNSNFYYASKYDDYFSSCDYIIGGEEGAIRIDLTVSSGRIWSFEENHSQPTMNKKIRRFHNSSGIPEEFFQSVHPNGQPKSLPLVIIRMNRDVLSTFAYDFFEYIATEKVKIDILEYFSHWIHHNPNITKDRIAYILWLNKESNESSLQFDQITKLVTQMGGLFAGMDGVSVTAN